MTDLNRRVPRVDTSRFALLPRPEIPRSTFDNTISIKTTFTCGKLVPLKVFEVLPSDVWQGNMTVFARLANLLFPLMDSLYLETFAFFCPWRILWTNWVKFQGEQKNPGDSISYTIPQVPSDGVTGFAAQGLGDYFGLPTAPQLTGGAAINVNAGPFRMYNLVWNEWFRDQNLQNALTVNTGDGPDAISNYAVVYRNKRHDYFTSALPWPLKGGVDVTLPMSGSAPVRGISLPDATAPTAGTPASSHEFSGATPSAWSGYVTGNALQFRTTSGSASSLGPYVYADLSQATGATINALRLAVATQTFLERDARSGTRYTELLRSHWGVTPEDSRLQRPEYIGGGRTLVQTQAIPQTSATGLTGGTTPVGSLTGQSVFNDQHSFTYYAKEHGFIMLLVNVAPEITYQQGVERMWTRLTRLDHYEVAFAHLGEQAIRKDELYATGIAANDTAVFGYQERWSEYRTFRSSCTSLFRSTMTGNIDEWHLGQEFTSQPSLNSAFILQDYLPVRRALAAGSLADNMQILFDSVLKLRTTRAMPMFSVPGLMDRF